MPAEFGIPPNNLYLGYVADADRTNTAVSATLFPDFFNKSGLLVVYDHVNNDGFYSPGASLQTSDSPLARLGTGVVPEGKMALHPGKFITSVADFVWTGQSTLLELAVSFEAVDSVGPTNNNVYVFVGSFVVYSNSLGTGQLRNPPPFQITVGNGDRIRAAVAGQANGQYFFGTTAVDILLRHVCPTI